MDFLKKLFNVVISKQELTSATVAKEVDEDETSTIGGPYRITTATQPAGFHRDERNNKNRVFSPSGRYILITVYYGNIKPDGLFLAPMLEIVDFANRKGRLYASSDSTVGKWRGQIYTSYWLTDSQIVTVYIWGEGNIVQHLYILDHEKRIYKEEVVEYVGEYSMFNRNRSHPNPLFIDNKAYFTITALLFLYLIPWIPSRKITQVTRILLNTEDPVLTSGNYRLIVGQESMDHPSFHFISGTRAYFYINKRTYKDHLDYIDRPFRDENHRGIFALPTEVACIDFAGCNELNVTEAHFNEGDHSVNGILAEFVDGYWTYGSYWIDWYSYGEKKEAKPISDKIMLCLRNYCREFPERLFFHGRYITHMAHAEDDLYLCKDGDIFDLQTMTWAKIPWKWFEPRECASEEDLAFNHNNIFQFYPASISGFEFEFAELRLGQPRWKSLADICRQKLVYNKESIGVSPKLLDIIFPSP